MPLLHPLHEHALSAVQAAEAIISRRPADVMTTLKGEADPVTAFDREAEAAVRETLARLTPDIPVYGEEMGGGDPTQGLWWSCDPIDGTVNFSLGSDECATMLSLLRDGETELAVVNFPFLGERYEAAPGKGAWIGETQLLLPQAPHRLEDIILITADTVRFGADPVGYSRWVSHWMHHAYRVRMPGASCAEMRFLLRGQGHVHVGGGASLHDSPPPLLIASEAGAISFNLSGDPSHALNHEIKLIGRSEAVRAVLESPPE